ncbi:MAG TPA: protein kinase [Candidatus Sulfotelmatobacter sp.]|nr:protein kinase [Candidatus Sulfotelmatobacter sp.]
MAIEFRVGESIGRYTVLQRPGVDSDPIAHPIGNGGTSFVYLVGQQIAAGLTIRRALKFFSPKERIREKRRIVGKTPGQHNFLDEIIATGSYTHQNLVKIIDAGNYDSDHPYFVMEYVDGSTLKDLLDSRQPIFDIWKQRAQKDPFLPLRMARQICWPIAYLHSENFFHFDIAPKNIFVREVNEKPHVLVGDLGVGRLVTPASPTAQSEPRKIFISGTKDYAPEVVKPFLNQEIDLSQLAGFAAYWDVFALGKVVREMIDAWGLSEHPDLDALRILCSRMMQQDRDISSSKASSELDRLLPTHVLTAGVEELSSDAIGKRKYISIPLYPVPISDRIRKLLNHRMLTRLQLVPQLLLVRSVTPGGVHTLYEHVLGCYAVAIKCITKLLSVARFRVNFSKKELEEALIAVLLVKLGSFQLDRILLTISPFESISQKVGHLSRLLEIKDETGTSVKDIIEKDFPDCDLNAVVQLVAGDEPTSDYQRLIVGLIKSSIDVRVMDYLVRDSHHTGIPAGLGIDIGNIVENLTWTTKHTGLGIVRAGVFSVEHLLCARFWMFNRLYWNQENRAITAMLRHVVHVVLKQGGVGRNYFINQMMDVDEAGALRRLKTDWENTVGRSYEDTTIVQLLQESRPRTYKTLVERFARNWNEDAMKGASQLDAGGLETLREKYIEQSKYRNKVSGSRILFDIPQESPLKMGEDIWVEVDREREEKLSNISRIVADLPKTFEETAIRLRVFYHPDLDDGLVESLRGEVQEFLDSEFGH